MERNFNHADGFEYICEVFLGKDHPKTRGIIEILNESLADKPTEPAMKSQTIKDQLPYLSSSIQKEVRYKLIIDPSEDESISRLLFIFDILNPCIARTYMCSDFPGDGQLLKVRSVVKTHSGESLVKEYENECHI